MQNTTQETSTSKILLYLPVIHDGYIKLIEKYPESEILILDESFIKFIDQEFDYLRKEIRALKPIQAKLALEAIFTEQTINLVSNEEFLNTNTAPSAQKKQEFIFPKEDIFIWLAEKYLPNANIKFDTTFLRWNRNNSTQKQQLELNSNVSKDEFSKKMMKIAGNQKDLSSDWWRQVGAVLVNNDSKKIISVAHNKHLPSPYTPYINSDPRNSFHKGENIDVSTAIHAEAALISQAAKNGISLEGTELYISTFPCPTCAKLVACSGISKLYFTEGYAMVDGEKILKDSGIEVVRVALL